MDMIMFQPNLELKGGVENVMRHIAKKYDPIIYTFRYNKEKTWPEFKDYDVRVIKEYGMGPVSGKFFTFNTARGFYNFKVKDDYDIINAHWGPSHWVRKNNPRVLWYCHSPVRAMYDLYDQRMKEFSLPAKAGLYFYSKYYRARNAQIVGDIEKVLCNSRNVQNRLIKYFDKRADVVYPGVDINEFLTGEYKKYFLVAGRITSGKRIEMAIEAFSLIREKFPEFKLVIAGSVLDSDAWYVEKLRAYGIADIKTNLSIDKYQELCSNAYAHLFTAYNEDFGIAPLEGMACGKPVISINEGGPKETIVDGKTGYLVSGAGEMALRMEELVMNESLVADIGKRGRLHVKENFSWTKFIEGFDKGVREVLRR